MNSLVASSVAADIADAFIAAPPLCTQFQMLLLKSPRTDSTFPIKFQQSFDWLIDLKAINLRKWHYEQQAGAEELNCFTHSLVY